jgi:hypothetical protein
MPNRFSSRSALSPQHHFRANATTASPMILTSFGGLVDRHLHSIVPAADG